jgi:hypothetical protein
MAAAGDCDPATAAALAEAWQRDALAEHASIASFARFTLELLSLGAPAELITDAQKAAADEIEHARLCFSLAARFAPERTGPGALPTDGAAPRSSLAACAAAAVLEGCVGETIAALMVQAQLERAADAQTLRALGRIAADEARHAALAWRFVAWALAVGDDGVRREVERAFADSARAPEPPPAPPVNMESWHRFGRLSAAEELEVARAAVREVIEPCARTLLRASSRPGAPERMGPSIG